MGAWGYGPFDSDGALDFLDDLEYRASKGEPAEPIVRARLEQVPGEYDWQDLYGAVGLVTARLGGYKGESIGTNLLAHLAARSGDPEATLELASEPLGLDRHTGKVELISEDEARALVPTALTAIDRLEQHPDVESWNEPEQMRVNLARLRALLEV